MSARSDRRDHMRKLADESFKDHILEPRAFDKNLKPYAWRCGRKDSNTYAFWVMFGPGCIAQYGDVGGLIIEQGYNYGLEWLVGAGESLDYVLSKSNHRKADEYVKEMFLEYLAENPIKDFELGYDGDYLDYHEYAMQCDNSEVGECVHDWSSTALWGYQALRKFAQLYKEKVDEELRQASTANLG